MKRALQSLFVIATFILFCCAECEEYESGLVPMYYSDELDVNSIEFLPARPFRDLGNPVLYQDYMFIVDELFGVHVIDNSNPEEPQNMGFINIPSVTQVTMSEGYLIVNFLSHLVFIDAFQLPEIVITEQITDFYGLGAVTQYPLNYTGFFECADPNFGTVIGWTETSRLKDPNCWR